MKKIKLRVRCAGEPSPVFAYENDLQGQIQRDLQDHFEWASEKDAEIVINIFQDFDDGSISYQLVFSRTFDNGSALLALLAGLASFLEKQT